MKIVFKSKKFKIAKGNAGNIGLLTMLYSLFRDYQHPGYVDMTNGIYGLNRIDGFPKGISIDEGEFLGIEDNKAWFVVNTSRGEIIHLSVEMKNDKLKIARVDKAPKYDNAKIQNDITAIENAGIESPGNNLNTWDAIEKALSFKYLRRWPKPNGKGWNYLYPKDFLRPIVALKTLFGFQEEKVTQVYEQHEIKKEFGADKKTFAAHILEYFSNKLKWDKYFEKKENREQNEKPVKMKTAKIAGTDTLGQDTEGQGKLFDNTAVIRHNKDEGLALNRSLMRKIYGIYNAEERNHGRDQSDTGQRTLSAGTPAVRTGGGQETGDLNVPKAKTGDDGREPLQLPIEPGKRSDRDVRHTVKETKNIREACLSLLKSKKDGEMTDEDKELLRQYEGAGGLGEADATAHGTLYEYYTPRSVTKKVWEIVDKYCNAAKKEVLEPSVGIGRFAEDRPNDNFTLNEYDSISARISGILHPEAKVTQGAFQAMFDPGKPYAGKKYDVVIGNPPYGHYEGLWKGKGEGKEHDRYEEYFIDRGLDTLREGGIMAFVVPSSFLRNGNDKIKEKIAAKGKLLEAWRLPNGTFNTTGVGTDIIIIRKEKGDPAKFSNNAYFAENPSMVIGKEETRIGRFGKEEQFVTLNGDDTFETALERIRADAVEAVPLGELTQVEEAKKKVKVSEGEAHRNRSEAMIGNQNAAGSHDVDSAEEFNAKYNKHIAPEALEIWKQTNWDGSIDVGFLEHGRNGLIEYMQKSGNYVQTADGKWYDLVNFTAGNIYEKLDRLERDKELIPKAEYERQKKILESVLPAPKTVMDFEVSPLSVIAESFITGTEDRIMNPNWKKPGQGLYEDRNLTLNEAFVKWISEARTDDLALPPDATVWDIRDYVQKKRVIAERARNDSQKEANQAEARRKVAARREAAERLFNQFIREQLSVEDQKRLADVHNRYYNAVNNVDYSKIPVFLDGIAKNFKGNPFKANETQVKGVSWLGNQGNGIVAFDVGVGKLNPLSEPVLTPTGWSTIGRLKEGDYVIAVDGKPTKVLRIYPQGILDIYTVKFSDGSTSRCGYEHLWDVQYPYQRSKGQCYGNKSNEWKTLTTREIHDDMKKSCRGDRKYTIPMCEPVQFEKQYLPIPAYAMGYLLGNGYFGEKFISVVIPDEYVKEKIGSLMPNGGFLKESQRPIDFYLRGIEDWRKSLKELGLSGKHSYDKFLPDNYKYSNVHDRIELLRGLMDSDGTVGGSGNTPIFYTTSKELSEDVKELVQSLGGTVTIHQKQGKYKKDGETIVCRLCYSVSMRLKGINPFSLPRKADKCIERTKYIPVRFIESIEYSHKEESACILVEHPRHLFVTNDYIVTHNTITALMAAVNDMQMGRCDKPIICVPKAVYKQWLAEAAELFPNLKINPMGNFSDISQYKNPDGTLNIEKGSVSICTEQALPKVGFKDETLNGELKENFMEALSSITEDEKENAAGGNKKAQRKSAKDEETIMTKVGKASKTGDNWVNWEDTGFDHITVDEAHRFRNSFSKPRNMEKGGANEFKDIPGGSTSLRGLKLFAITQMIQKRNNGRNVHLLTATPFQNSPVEIYNMLSYVAREQLKEAGIYNFHEFLTQFAELKSEISVDSKNNITQKNVMKGFKNLQALQRLLNQYIMKVDGEDAGIIRPDKKDWFYDLNATAEQKDITEKIRAYLEEGPDMEKDPGATLRCINALRQAALSPVLVNDFKFLDKKAAKAAGIHEDKITVKGKDFVKDSPKMSFVCDSTVNLYKLHPDKGQIIHLPQGIEHYEDVKNYLVKQGIPADAIAFLSPEYLRAGDEGNDDKMEITAAFNDPKNKLKIIIGSDTIKEGVNLNGNTIETYPCMIPWNPTDLEQLIGRSWRQGNHQGMVHITIPLMNDSIDSFMYQKHDEKGSRLETLWNSKAQKIDVDGIDPEELKFSLIKDPKKRADLFIKEKTAELVQKQKIAAATSDKIFGMAGEWKNLSKENADHQSEIDKLKRALDAFNAKTDQALMEEHDIDFKVSWRNHIYDDYANVRGKNMKEIRENYGKEIKNQIADAQKSIQRNNGKMATIDNTLKRYGIENSGNMATVERVRKRYSKEAMDYKAQIDAIEANREQYVREAARKIKEESKTGISVSEAVSTNTRIVSENLYPMEKVKERIANESKVEKSVTLIMQGNIYIKRQG